MAVKSKGVPVEVRVIEKVEAYDLHSALMAYEDGLLDEEGTVVLFQVLVSTGLLRHLQGSYQREAQRLVRAGLVQTN